MAVHDRVLRPDSERTTVATTKCRKLDEAGAPENNITPAMIEAAASIIAGRWLELREAPDGLFEEVAAAALRAALDRRHASR
jgi:hypothetical protein